MGHSIRTVACAGIIFMAAACVIGPEVSTFSPAIRPEGIPASLHIPNDSLRVELLSVERDALLVLVEDTAAHHLAGRLAWVPLTAIRRGEFEHAGDVMDVMATAVGFALLLPVAAIITYALDDDWTSFHPFGGGEQPEALTSTGTSIATDPELLHRLRLLSRYPQGVDDLLLARLEAAYGESATLDPGGDL